LLKLTIYPRESLFEPANVGTNIGAHWRRGSAQPILFAHKHLDDLAAAAYQISKVALFRVGHWSNFRTNGFSKMSQN